MKLTKISWVAVLAVCALAPGCATTNGSQNAVVRAKDRVAPALVHIRPVKEVFRGGRREQQQVTGSGFIVSRDGYVVTNHHVAGANDIVRCVLYDKDEVFAEVVGVDPYTDLAVLKLETNRTNLPVAKLARPGDIEPGQTVIALGSPHGLARSVSLGIISVVDRYLEGSSEMIAPFNTWIQTDAAINPGNSGGPLVNLRGEVVGVNARRLTNADNVGFAIPIATVHDVVESIIADGRVRRSWLGLTLQEMTRLTDDPSVRGVLVAYIDPLSPCATSGLRAGDVITALNGNPINARFVEELPYVRQAIADLPIGEPVAITLRRANGEPQTIEATTVERSELRGQEVAFDSWGFTGAEVTPYLARRARLASTDGVLVTGTQVGLPAENAGLGSFDVILTIDDKPVKGIEDFRTHYDAVVASGQESVLLDVRNIQRNSLITRYVLVKQDGGETEEENGNE